MAFVVAKWTVWAMSCQAHGCLQVTDLASGVGPQCACKSKQAHLMVWVDSLSKLCDKQSQSYGCYVLGSDS